jgi:hypothetical protein
MIRDGSEFRKAFLSAALMALPTRIEIEREADTDQSLREEVESLLQEWAESVLDELEGSHEKKK